MHRGPGRERERRAPPRAGEVRRAERDAALALTPPRSEPRVSLERLEIAVPARDGVVEIVQGDVFTPAREGLHASSCADRIGGLRTRSALRTSRRPSRERATGGPA